MQFKIMSNEQRSLDLLRDDLLPSLGLNANHIVVLRGALESVIGLCERAVDVATKESGPLSDELYALIDNGDRSPRQATALVRALRLRFPRPRKSLGQVLYELDVAALPQGITHPSYDGLNAPGREGYEKRARALVDYSMSAENPA